VRLDLHFVLAFAEELHVIGAPAQEGLPNDVPSDTRSRLGLTA
jgi:hypothetical protein